MAIEFKKPKTVKVECPFCEADVEVLETDESAVKECPSCRQAFVVSRSMIKRSKIGVSEAIVIGFLTFQILAVIVPGSARSWIVGFVTAGVAAVLCRGKKALLVLAGFVTGLFIACVAGLLR